MFNSCIKYLALIHVDQDCNGMQIECEGLNKLSYFFLFEHISFSGYLFSLHIKACIFLGCFVLILFMFLI